ncbi:MAG TPA: hypothetical protein VGE52_06835, partial [Pirellulales bacterium]
MADFVDQKHVQFVVVLGCEVNRHDSSLFVAVALLAAAIRAPATTPLHARPPPRKEGRQDVSPSFLQSRHIVFFSFALQLESRNDGARRPDSIGVADEFNSS